MLFLAALPLASEAVPPQVTTGSLLREAATVAAWPLQLDLPDVGVLTAAASATLAVINLDKGLYGDAGRLHWTLGHHSLTPVGLLLGNGAFDAAVAGAFDAAVAGAFALGGPRARRTSIEGLQALVAVAITSTLMKHMFREARPEVDPGHKTWFGAFSDDSFPSGHAMSAFALASVISANYPSAAPFAYFAAAGVGLSVIKRGWHWPSDVLVGSAVGFVIARASVRVHEARVGPNSLTLQVLTT
jgi:membrane-associated phospholipid phosphatase